MTSSQTIIHISDLHFINNNQSVLQGLKENHQLFSKRHLGWLNYKFRRQDHFDPGLKERLIHCLLSIDWDYLIITGDISTLALKREFELAYNKLKPLIDKGTVLFTAGNHDRYVKTPNHDYMKKYFGECWPFNQKKSNREINPFIELNSSVVLFELEMAIPRIFYSSRGRLLNNLNSIEKKLKNQYKDHLKIAIGHYPAFLPPGEHEGYLHSLSNRKQLQQFLLDNQIGIYLHGHIHKSWMFKPNENSNLICINSGGCCRHSEGEWSGFNKITLKGKEISVERLRC